MIHVFKISFLILSLFITSCDEDIETLGCTNELACNYDSDATEDNGSCELNLFCYDADGDGFGYGDTTQICLDEIPDGWIPDCSDLADDCVGTKDDCGECNGNNQNKDCNDICFGNSVSDMLYTCCHEDKLQTLQPLSYSFCFPDTFKWSLKMTATMGEYIDSTFIPSSDSIYTEFTIGSHYLSTDGLDIFEDINYSDIVQPPSTVENSIYFYTSHPEWDYQFGNNFIREYKSHNMDSMVWNGYMTSDFYGQKHVQFTFELDSEENIWSNINLNFNNEENIAVIDPSSIVGNGSLEDCESDLSFHNLFWNNLGCDITDSNFEYIIPVTFQGSSYLMPFSIEILNVVLYEKYY